MSRMTKTFLVTFAMALMAHLAYAQEPGKPTVRVIHGTFTSETGQTVDFRVPEGRGVIVKNKALNVSYRMVAQIVDEQKVVFKVTELPRDLQKGAPREIENFELALGDEPRPGSTVPFALAFKGISTEVKGQKLNRATAPSAADAQATAAVGGSCCVQCGGWEVCCEPAAGWCCDISSSCGSSCSACNAI